MCLLALFFRAVPDVPVIVGANREERYDRGGEPPRILQGAIPAVAGIDPVAGGTWLGVNARGVLIAVTNRPKSSVPPAPRSRGLLVRELLECPSAAVAADIALRELDSGKYSGCNLLCIDADTAVVLHAADWLRVRPLPPGLHVVTARDVNDENDARGGYALWWLSERGYASAADCVGALQELCPQTGNGAPPMCVRGKEGGTVSSSIVSLPANRSRAVYLHAQGPPDVTPYADYSQLLRQITRPGGG